MSRLFSPIDLRSVRLKNRIVLAPMLTYAANNGQITDWHLIHLGKFAIGGVGLVFMESTKIDPSGCTTARDPGIWKDDFIEPLKRLTTFIKSCGAAAGIQLGHSGRKARNSLPWEGRAPLDSAPGVDHGEPWELIGPSAVPHSTRGAAPRAMTLKDISDQLDAWELAAIRAHRAGFDVLEIHGAHGYLVHQFLSPIANQRTDDYGGTLANRMRFALDIVKRVRAVWPDDKPLFFRTSAVDEDGWTLNDTVELSRSLKTLGGDVVDCSSGGMTAASISEIPNGYGYQVPYAEKVRRAVQIKTMAVGLIVHADQAERILTNGQADLIGIGRELLHNPNWALDAALKLGIDSPHQIVPENYGYWLEKRVLAGLGRNRTSTWLSGIDSDKSVIDSSSHG